jgi:hypothetical protein
LGEEEEVRPLQQPFQGVFMAPRKNGIMPSVSTQLAIGMSQGDIAYRVARSQASRGVPTDLASKHGVNASTAILYYAFFVFPVMMFTALFVWTPNPIVMLWKLVQVTLGVVILVRLHKWVYEPATNVISYKVPTWVLVVAGGVSAIMFCLFFLFLVAIS